MLPALLGNHREIRCRSAASQSSVTNGPGDRSAFAAHGVGAGVRGVGGGHPATAPGARAVPEPAGGDDPALAADAQLHWNESIKCRAKAAKEAKENSLWPDFAPFAPFARPVFTLSPAVGGRPESPPCRKEELTSNAPSPTPVRQARRFRRAGVPCRTKSASCSASRCTGGTTPQLSRPRPCRPAGPSA